MKKLISKYQMKEKMLYKWWRQRSGWQSRRFYAISLDGWTNHEQEKEERRTERRVQKIASLSFQHSRLFQSIHVTKFEKSSYQIYKSKRWISKNKIRSETSIPMSMVTHYSLSNCCQECTQTFSILYSIPFVIKYISSIFSLSIISVISGAESQDYKILQEKELDAFLAILIASGITQHSKIPFKMLWKESNYVPTIFSGIMNR